MRPWISGSMLVVGLVMGLVADRATGVDAAQIVDPIPLSGLVVDLHGQPLANAQVKLVRHFEGPVAAFVGMKILGSGTTDDQGIFELGTVDLSTQVNFPLETSVSFTYLIVKDAQARPVTKVDFAAPRVGTTITSIAAKIYVK